jgi:hypothetical protein
MDREVTVVKELASLVGQPIVVDELSLIRDELVRVKINCRNPEAIRCTIKVFFNKEGKQIKFMVEGGSGKTQRARGGPSGGGGKNVNLAGKTPMGLRTLRVRGRMISLRE